MNVRKLAVSLTVAGLAVAACGSSGGGSGGGPAHAAAGAAESNATVTVGLTLEPGTLDITKGSGVAISQILLNNVYQGLLKRDQKNAVSPSLAKSFETSADGLTYTFHLVSGVKFDDGKPLAASDVVSSLKAASSPTSTNPYAAGLASIRSVTAPDAATVVVTLKQRDNDLQFNLAGPAGVVVPAGATDLAARPDGTGPFTFADWKHGYSITLARNDAYRGPKAKVAKVVFRYISDVNAQNNAVKTGQVDVGGIADYDLVQSYRGNPNFVVTTGTGTDKFTLAFNNTAKPLNDPRVRHALRQGIDKNALVKLVGSAVRIGSYVPPLDPWYEDLTGIDAYNPANAKKLLAQAGYAKGLTLTLTIPNIYPAPYPEFVASQLKQIGVTVKINSVAFPVWLTQVHGKGDYQLSIVDHAEAHDIGEYALPAYYFHYDNPKVQKLYAASVTAPTAAEQASDLKQVAEQLSNDAASDWLFLGTNHLVARKGVTGFPTNNINSLFDASAIQVSKS